MRARIIAIEIVKISVLSGLVLVAIGCSSSGNKLAISTIPDSSLETLYGGCGWFDNPYCVNGGGSCPVATGCGELVVTCCLCAAMQGTICHAGRSYWPDFDGCQNNIEECPWGCIEGYCNEGICVSGGGEGSYPDCYGVFSVCFD